MRIKGQGHGLAARGSGDTQGFLDQRPVAKVHPIEIADGHGGATQGSAQVCDDAVAA
jgi:hypothetical protein